ncbi:MAG TPA: hypothetical protein VEL11_11960 [Candidatus Bathyarchaeia archaeon]|nr:hypothetical protein [Candidatus Bathyarchaeia archaeon]
MIKSFEVIPQNSRAENEVSTYQNSDYGIQIQYPSVWSKQESTASGTPINVVTLVSPTGPDSNPTADISSCCQLNCIPTTADQLILEDGFITITHGRVKK